jgi:hypothetical protein
MTRVATHTPAASDVCTRIRVPVGRPTRPVLSSTGHWTPGTPLKGLHAYTRASRRRILVRTVIKIRWGPAHPFRPLLSAIRSGTPGLPLCSVSEIALAPKLSRVSSPYSSP